MNRDIRFRGLRVDGKGWACGSLVIERERPGRTAHFIVDGDGLYLLVKPDTVGQLWKKDCEGVDMYSGDKVSVHQFLFDGNEIEEESIAIVGTNEDGFTLEFISGDFVKRHTGEDNPICMATDVYGLHEESFKIIGNIHSK